MAPRTRRRGRTNAYDELLARAREVSLMESIHELLEWDHETYMPRGGVEHRSRQLALVAGMQHERATDPRWAELLAELETSSLLEDPMRPGAVNVRELRRRFDRLTRLPRALVEDLASTAAIAEAEWAEAYRTSDFLRFAPWLERLVRLKRDQAACLGFAGSPYDALLDEYEPGATAKEVGALLASLATGLSPLVEAIAGARKRPDAAILRRDFPVERQKIFAESVAAKLGFDLERGRLDVTLHPFCARIGPGDCRLATRHAPQDFAVGFFALLHEVGHGLYEQGLDPAHEGTPLGEVASLGVHESQARLWENAVGKSRAFWTHFFPAARDVFHDALRDVSPGAFHFAVNQVEPSLVRTRADEVTYNLHVVARFDLERALIEGSLDARDVPGAWSEAYRGRLGIEPTCDREGCLQDGHWAAGMFGYFPTYALGDVYAAALHARAEEDLGGLDGPIAEGRFEGLVSWLRGKVHRHGKRLRGRDLIEEATGEAPSTQPLLRALRAKYGELYGV